MTKSELDTLDSVFLAPLILFVNQYLGTKFSESRLLWISLVSLKVKFQTESVYVSLSFFLKFAAFRDF